MSDLAGTSPHPTARHVLVGWLAALATVTIWALWAVATRHAVTHDLPPAAVGLLRFGVPALVLAPIAWRIGLFPKDLSLLKGLGLLGSGAPFFLIVAWGMQFAPAAEIGPLLPGTMPLFVALIGWLLFGERLAGVRVLGFVLILVGIAGIGGYGVLFAADGVWRGHLLLLTGAGLWGIYTHAYRHSGLSVLQAAALIGLWSFLILLPFGMPPLVQAFGKGLAGPIVLQALLQGLLSGVAGIILYGMAIDRLGASRAAAVSPLAIVLAALIAIPVLGEIPSPAAWVGIILATSGVVLASGIVSR
ncbi:drug/metabolite transporter (DMT)-like permease [Microvirga lupini]|uniref:Drug/metabolite transporter (DMT)-like permease n=1 Tax=Microvirga lupini TaxID=420324 RepID=A0A7W4VQ49_9HYPH|nr:DMT family transporter [Microvirga lupini]MBB3021001.1 drug/metabolite transporter (DMT)-like permease [Microvirga lupini]